MDQTLETLYQSLVAVYKKDTDQDFPTNKIRFFMDFLWNGMLGKPLTEEQKISLKNLIDLLNSLDDHKLSPTRDLITNMSPTLTPLLTTYPSLGHTFTFVITTLIPAYQRYLTSLEGLVKIAHPFTRDEVFLYYDMTLVDHAILSHVFESEQDLNLVEVITSIKTVIVVNAITHDYLQDSLGRSISLFTFLQRGGLAKEKCHEYYIGLIDGLLENMKKSVTNEKALTAVTHLCTKLVELTTRVPETPVAGATNTGATNEVDQLNSLLTDATAGSAPTEPMAPAPVQDSVTLPVQPPIAQMPVTPLVTPALDTQTATPAVPTQPVSPQPTVPLSTPQVSPVIQDSPAQTPVAEPVPATLTTPGTPTTA